MLVPQHYILVLINKVYMVVLQVGVRFAFQVLKINTLYSFSIYFGRKRASVFVFALLCEASACLLACVRVCECVNYLISKYVYDLL